MSSHAICNKKFNRIESFPPPPAFLNQKCYEQFSPQNYQSYSQRIVIIPNKASRRRCFAENNYHIFVLTKLVGFLGSPRNTASLEIVCSGQICHHDTHYLLISQ